MRLRSIISFVSIVTMASLTGLIVRAQDYGLGETAKATGYDQSQTIYGIVGTVTSGVLAAVVFIFFGLTMYAGLRWLTARGNQEFVEKAKSTLTAAIIGLVVTLSAYGLTAFIFDRLQTVSTDATQNSGSVTNSGGSVPGGSVGACANGQQDGTETDVDCGGSCDPCKSVGLKCTQNKDCALGPCVGGQCTAGGPSCNDRIQNRDESDMDCGGQYCSTCPARSRCNSASDCGSGLGCIVNPIKKYTTCGGG